MVFMSEIDQNNTYITLMSIIALNKNKGDG